MANDLYRSVELIARRLRRPSHSRMVALANGIVNILRADYVGWWALVMAEIEYPYTRRVCAIQLEDLAIERHDTVIRPGGWLLVPLIRTQSPCADDGDPVASSPPGERCRRDQFTASNGDRDRFAVPMGHRASPRRIEHVFSFYRGGNVCGWRSARSEPVNSPHIQP